MQRADAQRGGGLGVALAVVDEEQLFGTDALAAQHVLVDFPRGFQQLAPEADVEAVEVSADGVPVAVKRLALRPFEEEGVGVGEQADAVTGFPQAGKRVEMALRDALEVAEPGVEALRVGERLADEAAQLADERLRRDLPALQLAEKSLLMIGVEILPGVGDPDFLESGHGLLVVDVEHHAAHVERYVGDIVSHFCLNFPAAKIRIFHGAVSKKKVSLPTSYIRAKVYSSNYKTLW